MCIFQGGTAQAGGTLKNHIESSLLIFIGEASLYNQSEKNKILTDYA